MKVLVHRVALFSVAVLSLQTLIGCSPVNIRCKVLPGEISTMAVVSASDPRFDEPGIADAEITVRQSGRAGRVVIRTTNDNGSVGVPLKGTGALSRPMAVEVRAEGYLPAIIESMPTPTRGQRLLVLLAPLRQAPSPSPSSSPDGP